MISIDFECEHEHRFEGFFKDYEAFNRQLDEKIIGCPLCGSMEVKRVYTGCSIQAKGSIRDGRSGDVLQALRTIRAYVSEHFENVGKDFVSVARAIHYGVEEERNIFGETTPREMKELADEGINIIPLPDVEKIIN